MRLRLINEDETGASIKGNSNFSSGSSVTDSDNKVPGVVARLMGLDSLPSSTFMEPQSPTFIDIQPLRYSHNNRRNLDYNFGNQIADSESLLSRVEDPFEVYRMGPNLQMMQCRSFERSQTESFPSKIAKPAPSIHHELLSPVKSPGLVALKHAVSIMKEPPRILESQPTMAKTTPEGSSSMPLRLDGLKRKMNGTQKTTLVGPSASPLKAIHEKMDVTNKSMHFVGGSKRLSESNASRFLRRQALKNSRNGSVETASSRVCPNSEDNSTALKNKRKSISLAIQAKAIVRRREVLNSSGNKSSTGRREQTDGKASQPFKTQANILKNVNKKSFMQNASTVLRQNNQKQKSFEKKISSSGSRTLGEKKRLLEGDHIDRNHVEYFSTIKNHKNKHFDKLTERPINWTEDSYEKGIDLVPFTFTAPMQRLMPNYEAFRVVPNKKIGLSKDHCGKRMSLDSERMSLSSRQDNVIGSNALNLLLEKNSSDLTCAVDRSRHDSNDGATSSSGSIFQDIACAPHRETTKTRGVHKLDECRQPSPVSILEPSIWNESCTSSDSTNTSIIEGNKSSAFFESQVKINSTSIGKCDPLDFDMELSYSASCSSVRIEAGKPTTSSMVKEFIRSSNWEFEYVKEILSNAELMFKDFALGRTRQIVNPSLYNQFEFRKGRTEIAGGESRLTRKLLFDGVSECLDLKCRRYIGGGSKTWAKGIATVRRKDLLAKEVFEEISGWKCMGDCMVDKLVEKNMSSHYEKWLDYEADAFGLGVKIEGQMFESLIDEVIADIVLY